MPSGTVTFLFTDIEGSTQLWERLQEAMQAPLARHDVLLHRAVLDHNGQIVKMTGDGCHAAFSSALDGALAALQAQQALAAEAWPEIAPEALRVRMGLYTGEAEARAGDYYGASVNRAARLMSAAHGGQILVSQAAADLLWDRLPASAALRDLGEHRLKDLTRPEHILQLTAPGLRADFPPIKSLNAFAHNLPVALTPFIGREREIEVIGRLLDKTRLLTLTGSGGIGKTRLLLQAAASLLSDFPDGAWLVELAPVADPALVVQTIAGSLGLRPQPDRPVFDALADFLRAKYLLLILDNCEHLIAACADAAERLLRQCPRLKIIASSREALGIAGETTYPVPSLSLPEAHPAGLAASELDLIKLAQSEAVRLFVERAQAALPTFTLANDNAASVALICRRLDGIPLAIELAAARVRLLRVDQIATRLDDRFRLLTGGSRTALPRQQTLRALIDWSYALLSKPERACLQQLSVFAGGWTLEAAEAVCSTPAILPDTFDLLAQLANKSLILVEREASQEARYRLLETVRQYAREKLLANGDPAPWRDGHLRYFLQHAEQNEPELHGPRLVAWLDRFEREHDNFRAALAWGLDSDPLAALQLARALAVFWTRRGYVSEGAGWLEAALARASAAAPAEAAAARPYQLARASALALRAQLDFATMHNIPAIRAAAEESVQLARQLGDDGVLGFSLAVLALASVYWGDTALAQAAAEEALALARPRNDVDVVGMAFGALALVRLTAFHKPAEARAIVAEGLHLARQQGDPWNIAQATLGVGRFASAGGDLDEARARIEEAIELFRQVGDLGQVNHARGDLARVLRLHGQTGQAIALYRETLRAWQHMGHRGAVAQQLESLAFIAIELGQGARAARLLGATETLREISGALRMTQQGTEYDQALAKLRGQLAPAELEAAWAAGRAMGMDEAVAYALSDDTG
jgi:predicted ATPase/class 3 adenylate cyclase